MVSVEDVDDQPGIGFSDFKMSERRSVVDDGMLDNLSHPTILVILIMMEIMTS